MERPLDSVVLTRMKKFSAMNKLRKAALLVIAKLLSADEINGARAAPGWGTCCCFQALPRFVSSAACWACCRAARTAVSASLAGPGEKVVLAWLLMHTMMEAC